MQEDLLKTYRECAVAHAEGTLSGNSTATNKAYDQLHIALKSLCKIGADDSILSLFDDENVSVQLWAAAHSLEVDEKKSVAALEKIISAGIPLVSMSARYTLQGWQNGELRVRKSF
jgi:hypothetical protein